MDLEPPEDIAAYPFREIMPNLFAVVYLERVVVERLKLGAVFLAQLMAAPDYGRDRQPGTQIIEECRSVCQGPTTTIII